MFMQKIELPAVTCDLFAVTKGFDGNGGSAVDRGSKPRTANEAEALAYADFIRRKNDLPDIGKPDLQRKGGYTGRGRSCPFIYVGATYGQHLGRGEYEAGAFSVLFPGANQMRQVVTMETLDESGEVLTSSTMPVEPKKGGIVWGKDEVRKACGPVAKVKAARTPTASQRTPIRINKRKAAIEPRRRALARAWNLRAMLRDERAISDARLAEIDAMRADARQMPEDCAAPATPTHVAPMLSDAILSDLAAAERLMSGAGYVAPKPRKVRALGHERAIRRAWAERKARRYAEQGAAAFRSMLEVTEAAHKRAEHEIAVRCDQVASLVNETQRLQDRAEFAEQEAAEAKAMRDEMRGMLAALERRAEMAEAENAELWAEIEALTAPITAAQGAIAAEAGAA